MPEDRPMPENTGAVIVTFHPDDGFPERLHRIRRQVGAVVIVDNASNAAAIQMLERLSREPGIHLLCNPENLGVAAALNIGFQWIDCNRFAWALAFDQDTEVEDHFLREMARVYEAAPLQEKLAVLGASFIDEAL